LKIGIANQSSPRLITIVTSPLPPCLAGRQAFEGGKGGMYNRINSLARKAFGSNH